MPTQLAYGALLLYLASLCCYAWFLYSNKLLVGRLATLCLVAALILHYLTLMERSHWTHTIPYNDLYGSTSLFAWLLALTYLGLEAYHRQRSIGPLVLPFVILLYIVSTIVGGAARPVPPPARGTLFAFHVTLNILAYSAFALAFVLSGIYLIQDRLLRDRRPSRLFWRFPALEGLERMSRSSVIVGLVSLCMGMIAGFVWQHRLRGHYWSADPKVIVTLGIGAVYAGYLRLSVAKGWRGARASLLCVLNFLVVIFSYTVVNLYLSRFHRYF